MNNRPQKIKELHQYLVQTILLTKNEAEAVISFKNGYRLINENIRLNALDEMQSKFCDDLNKGLHKMQKTESEIVYRNLNFADFQLKKITSYFNTNMHGKISIPDFQSCTKLDNFTGNIDDYNCTFIVSTAKNTAAAEIHTLWNQFELNDAELEVIFPMNTCFEILSLEATKRVVIDLKELNNGECTNQMPKF